MHRGDERFDCRISRIVGRIELGRWANAGAGDAALQEGEWPLLAVAGDALDDLNLIKMQIPLSRFAGIGRVDANDDTEAICDRLGSYRQHAPPAGRFDPLCFERGGSERNLLAVDRCLEGEFHIAGIRSGRRLARDLDRAIRKFPARTLISCQKPAPAVLGAISLAFAELQLHRPPSVPVGRFRWRTTRLLERRVLDQVPRGVPC